MPRPPTTQFYIKTCPICGRVFRTSRRRKTYCNEVCYERARKRRWYKNRKQRR